MASLRPEGALNSAKGLVEIGRIDDALEALHQVLSNRRYRQWNATMEKIAEEYVKLCLSAGRTRYAKDGLIQFRNICQPNNLQSLDGILKLLRSLAEEKVRSTRGKLVTGADGLVDLEETESGESLLLSALSAEPAVVDERAARAALRDLWDTLRTILDVCRNHAALDETYHATAIMAFDFCSEFKRKNEFRRICETLRLHQQQATWTKSSTISAITASLGGQSAAPQVDPLTRTIDTRNYQVKVAVDLSLWSVAFNTVEEMHSLLAKKRPTQTQLVSYYQSLSKILLMSSHPTQRQLFHAACLLKLLNLVSSTASAATIRAAADRTTLAVLAASVSDALAAAAVETQLLAGDAEGASIDFAAEKSARLVQLTGSGGVPTPQSLMSDLISKDIVSLASEEVRKLFAVLTEDSSTKEAGWINAKFPQLISQISQETSSQYLAGISRLAIVKITKDMQSMYSCVRFERFESATKDIMPMNESVRLLGQLKRTEQIDVSIDYHSRTVSFGSSPSASSGVSSLNSAIAVIRDAAARIHAKKSENSILEKAHAILLDEDAFFARLEKDRRRCEDRRNASDARNEALENEHVRKAHELADQLHRAEEERLEADARARAAEAARKEREAKKREEQLVKAKAIVEKMAAFGGAGEAGALTDEQLVSLGTEKLELLQKDQFAKERQDRISKRRNESRRLEHTARLLRTAENEKIVEWSVTVHGEDKQEFSQIAEGKAQEWRQAAEAKKASIKALVPFSSVLMFWKSTKVDEFNHKLALKAEERRIISLAAKAALSKQNSDKDLESDVAPTSILSREEFKEMAKSLPSWKDATPQPESDNE